MINVIKSATPTVNILLSGLFLRGSGFVPFVVRLETLMYNLFNSNNLFKSSQTILVWAETKLVIDIEEIVILSKGFIGYNVLVVWLGDYLK